MNFKIKKLVFAVLIVGSQQVLPLDAATERQKDFRKAIQAGAAKRVLEFIRARDVDLNQASDADGYMPLHLAINRAANRSTRDALPGVVYRRYQNIVVALIAAGANVNARLPRGGDTPLHICCWSNLAPLARILVEAGAEVNSRSHGGLTPLMHAATGGGLKSVTYLLREAGADPMLRSEAGQTAADLAQEHVEAARAWGRTAENSSTALATERIFTDIYNYLIVAPVSERPRRVETPPALASVPWQPFSVTVTIADESFRSPRVATPFWPKNNRYEAVTTESPTSEDSEEIASPRSLDSDAADSVCDRLCRCCVIQ